MVCAFAGVFVYAVGGGIASAATATNVVDAAYGGLSVTPPTPSHGLRMPRLRVQIPR